MSVSDSTLCKVVPLAYSYAGVLRLLGLKQHSKSQRLYKARIIALGIDTTHFTGQSHATKGLPCSCVLCKKVTSDLGIQIHIKLAHTPEGVSRIKALNDSIRGKPSWNKGLSPSNETREKLSKAFSGRLITEQTKKAISATAKKNGNSGGYRIGGGRGKKGWYKGFWCDSSWELAFVVFHLDRALVIQRCTNPRDYIWKNKPRKYYPDFIVEGVVVEIKGYSSPQWEAKLSANLDVQVIGEKEIQFYLDYVRITYGKDFVRLYEQQRVGALEASHLGKVIHPAMGDSSIL